MSDAKAFARTYGVSRETLGRLEAYAELLEKWNSSINLVSMGSLAHLWSRHFGDSAQLISIAPAGKKRWVDLGSGAGFPGAVLGILLAEHEPDAEMTLVESDQRKATFLRQVARDTGVTMTVLSQRIEDLAPLNAEVLTARALAPLTALLDFADRHMAKEGVAIFPKGAAAQKEIEDALASWRFACEPRKSQTDEESSILIIREIERV